MPIEAIFTPQRGRRGRRWKGGRRGERGALVAAALVAALLVAGFPLDAWLGHALRWQRTELGHGQLWRVLTAHVAHLSWAHALLNAAALLLVLQIFRTAVTAREWWLTAAASVVVIDAGLWWLEPGIAWYAGASGVLHGLFVMGLAGLWRGGEQRLALALAAGLVLKLGFEWWHGPLAGALDLPVATAAHRYGALGGLIAVALLLRKRPDRRGPGRGSAFR